MITPGTMLIEANAPRPPCFQLQTGAAPRAWMPVTHQLTSRDLEKELASTGWTFFYMASAIHATAAGFNREKAIDSALQRVIAGARLQHCNCIEIDEVSAHSFLGISYVSVSAHMRHIQKGTLFSGQ
jgi:hypothetical protein